MAINLKKQGQKREALLKQQFAAQRNRLSGQQRETERQSAKQLNRLAATTGKTGGAIAKIKQQSLRDIGQAFGDAGTSLAGQEAGALEQVRSQTQAQRLAQEEAQKERDLRESQFSKSLDFQKDSFADQMRFQWAEFNENKRTNFINSLTALKDNGFGEKDMEKIRFLVDKLFPGGATSFSQNRFEPTRVGDFRASRGGGLPGGLLVK